MNITIEEILAMNDNELEAFYTQLENDGFTKEKIEMIQKQVSTYKTSNDPEFYKK